MFRHHPVVARALDPVTPRGILPHCVGVHGRIVDLRNFDHPGGAAWMRVVGGTEVTALFVSTHLNAERARRALDALPVVGRYDAPSTDFAAYERVRATMLRHFPTRASRRAPAEGILTLGVAALVHLLLLATTPPSNAWMLALVASALTSTLAGAVGHNHLHRLDARALGLDWNGLSTLEWMLEHVLSHHPHVNSAADHDAISMHPFVDWTGSATPRHLVLYPLFLVAELAVAAQGLVGHRCRWRTRGLPRHLVVAPWLFVARALSLVLAHGAWWGVVGFLLACALASFYFAFLAHLNHVPAPHARGDFLVEQLANTRDLRGVPSPFHLGLDRQVAHHLFPTVDHARWTRESRAVLDAALAAEGHVPLAANARQLHAQLWRRLISPVRRA